MSEKTLLYKPLNNARKEIRLLEFPTDHDADVTSSYRLIIVSILDRPCFSALSYVWGNSSSTEPILLNGIAKQVTNNLASALRHICKAQDVLADTRLLWADAICINQTDLNEKNHQIPLMGDIYGTCKSVVSWLGTDAWIASAFETLQIVSQEAPTDSNDLEWLRRHPDLFVQDRQLDDQTLIPNNHWESLRSFARLTYWSRMWIFQEIALSQHLIFMIPDKCMGCDTLEAALARARSLFSSFADHNRVRPNFINETMWEYLPRLTVVGDVSFKLIERHLVARQIFSRAETQRNERPALCILSAFTGETRATDLRDFYYSLIGVSQIDLVPDYRPRKSVQNACMEFVGAYITATRDTPWTLLFLHDALGQRGRDIFELPSWAPMYHLPEEMQGRLRNPDSEAKAGSHALDGLSQRRPPEMDGQVLRVFGASITSVTLVACQPSGVKFWLGGEMGTYLLDFVRRHGAVYKTGIPAATALFTTLQRNISGTYDFVKGLMLLQSLRGTLNLDDGSDAQQVWSDIQEAYRQSRPQDDTVDGPQGVQDLVTEWVQTLASYGIMKLGRLFEMSGGYLGLAPSDVREGDIVCVLDGASYPLVVRQVGESYILIGECFVQGLMKGEARDILASGQASAKAMELI
ncbi:heterokaryon incompatibility protein-domain-containing protein [Xylaria nigripes]|nr:heterokaryon incompatibility protein-domain-containing protein [Xylaria nigripes]